MVKKGANKMKAGERMIKKLLDLLIAVISVIGIVLCVYFLYYLVTEIFPLMGI